MVLACKTDLEKRIDSEEAARIVEQYAKIVEVSQHSDEGKGRMRKAVDVLVRQVSMAMCTYQFSALMFAAQYSNSKRAR